MLGVVGLAVLPIMAGDKALGERVDEVKRANKVALGCGASYIAHFKRVLPTSSAMNAMEGLRSIKGRDVTHL